MSEIKLGDRVKDTITPFKGIVIGITKWINGCDRMTVQSEKLKDNVPQEPFSFDITQLKLVKPRKKPLKKKNTGGPHKPVSRVTKFKK